MDNQFSPKVKITQPIMVELDILQRFGTSDKQIPVGLGVHIYRTGINGEIHTYISYDGKNTPTGDFSGEHYEAMKTQLLSMGFELFYESDIKSHFFK